MMCLCRKRLEMKRPSLTYIRRFSRRSLFHTLVYTTLINRFDSHPRGVSAPCLCAFRTNSIYFLFFKPYFPLQNIAIASRCNKAALTAFKSWPKLCYVRFGWIYLRAQHARVAPPSTVSSRCAVLRRPQSNCP